MEDIFRSEAARLPLCVLGLDYGSKTVGVAASDALGLTAQGLEIIRRKSEKKLRQTLARIDEIAKARGALGIVLGFPMTLRGGISERTARTLQFRQMVMKRTGLPVFLWDERLSTVSADRAMDETQVSDHREYVDEIAAMLILQGYLDLARSGKSLPEVDADRLLEEYQVRHPDFV